MRRRCRASSRSIMHGSRRSASLRRVIVLRVPIRLSAVPARGSQEAGRRSRGVEFAPDSPLEEAVTSELVSAGPIPCYTGKIQGISLVLASGTRIGRLNPYYNQSFTSKFPTRRNRELNGLQQGIKSAHQGNFSPDQGTSITRPGPDTLGRSVCPAEEFSSNHDRAGHLRVRGFRPAREDLNTLTRPALSCAA
jgi:hypothetical protein